MMCNMQKHKNRYSTMVFILLKYTYTMTYICTVNKGAMIVQK